MSKYKIFPDYTSTGVWLIKEEESTSFYSQFCRHVSCELPDYVPNSLKIALQYWHDVWELNMNDNYEWESSVKFRKCWYNHGKEIVEELNALGVDLYIYDVNSREI